MKELFEFEELEAKREKLLEELRRSVPGLLRQYREANGLSLSALSEQLGCTYLSALRMEQGQQVGVPLMLKFAQLVKQK